MKSGILLLLLAILPLIQCNLICTETGSQLKEFGFWKDKDFVALPECRLIKEDTEELDTDERFSMATEIGPLKFQVTKKKLAVGVIPQKVSLVNFHNNAQVIIRTNGYSLPVNKLAFDHKNAPSEMGHLFGEHKDFILEVPFLMDQLSSTCQDELVVQELLPNKYLVMFSNWQYTDETQQRMLYAIVTFVGYLEYGFTKYYDQGVREARTIMKLNNNAFIYKTSVEDTNVICNKLHVEGSLDGEQREPLFDFEIGLYTSIKINVSFNLENIINSLRGSNSNLSMKICGDDSSNGLLEDYCFSGNSEEITNAKAIIVMEFDSDPLLISAQYSIKKINGNHLVYANQSGLFRNWPMADYTFNQTANITEKDHQWEEITFKSKWLEAFMHLEKNDGPKFSYINTMEFNWKKGTMPNFNTMVKKNSTYTEYILTLPSKKIICENYRQKDNPESRKIIVKHDTGRTKILAQFVIHKIEWTQMGLLKLNFTTPDADYSAILALLINATTIIYQNMKELMYYSGEINEISRLFIADWPNTFDMTCLQKGLAANVALPDITPDLIITYSSKLWSLLTADPAIKYFIKYYESTDINYITIPILPKFIFNLNELFSYKSGSLHKNEDFFARFNETSSINNSSN